MRSRSALTLIEVIASIVLISTLLAGMLVCHGRHQRQIALSHEIETATKLADELLADWFLKGKQIDVGMSGSFSTAEGFYWQTRAVNKRFSNAEWNSLDQRFILFEVFSANHQDPLFAAHLISTSQLIRGPDE